MMQVLADCQRKESKFTEAEELYKRALKIDKQAYGSAHPHVAECLTNLG